MEMENNVVRKTLENIQIKIICFGITRDIIGQFDYSITLEREATVADLKQKLSLLFPAFHTLKSLRIAVNAEYAADSVVLNEKDEVVLIPPVSGG